MMVDISCELYVGCIGYRHSWKSSSTDKKYQVGYFVTAFVFSLASLFVINSESLR
ncbi:hypothetical protein Hanom_Chr08g00717141 [Helianthus anomalus]